MAETAEQLYEAGRQALEACWSAIGASGDPVEPMDPTIAGDIERAINSTGVAQRFAIPTQLLIKLVRPDWDALDLRGFPSSPVGFSARAFCKNVIVPFNQQILSPLGTSTDPYVSQPLRGRRIEVGGEDPEAWKSVVKTLEFVNAHPELAERMLRAALRQTRSRQLDLGELLAKTLDVQVALHVDPKNKSASTARRELVSERGPAIVRSYLDGLGLAVEGSSGFGADAEVPWIRIYDPAHSPSAQSGLYVVYLFAADGGAAYLALALGTESFSASELSNRVDALRNRIGQLPEGLITSIDLASTQGSGSRPKKYEAGAICAVRYQRGSIPQTSHLLTDATKLIDILRALQPYVEEESFPGAAQPPPARAANFDALTVDLVMQYLATINLRLSKYTVAAAVSALAAGKHLMLMGAPGTGKTTFATAIGYCAQQVGLTAGVLSTTATSDWTSMETVGGFWPDEQNHLTFRRGQVLAAIDDDRWALIDEFNRADIDKAFGQMFTVLSGQAVVLPYVEKGGDGVSRPPSIVPPGATAPTGTQPHFVSPSWRLVVTMNTRDRDLLFSLSYALMRRFAVIEIPIPSKEELEGILGDAVEVGDIDLSNRLNALASVLHNRVGPSILIDCGRYLRERNRVLQGERGRAMAEAISAYVVPQIAGYSRNEQAAISVAMFKACCNGLSLDDFRLVLGESIEIPEGSETS